MSRIAVACGALAFAASSLVGATTALAAPVVSTSFPGVEVQPGKTVTFPLSIGTTTAGHAIVGLAVGNVPKGWKALLKGNGYLINQAYVQSTRPGSVSLEVQVPAGAQPGIYHLDVRAKSQNGQTKLPLAITVASTKKARPTLAAQYPSLQGSDSASFQFQVTLTNNSFNEQSFGLTAKKPSGWQVTFQPAFGSKQISAIPVKAGSSQSIDVNVTPPGSATPGTYPIVATASAGPGQTVSVPLKVQLTGSYQVALATPSGRLNASVTAGSTKTVPILVKNTGTGVLTNLSLTASAPSNWNASFKPAKLPQLQPGQVVQVQLGMHPSGKVIAGDYQVTATASNQNANANQTLRVTVQTSTLWGWIGVLIVLVVAAGLGFLFQRLGRR